MFTGIIETVGHIKKCTLQNGCKYFTIAPQHPFRDVIIGESIAVNGVCLTVTHFTDTTFDVTAVPETRRLTNLDELQIGNVVNLEQSLKSGSRIGGHYVQGHVDGMGKILEIKNDASEAWLVKISIPTSLAKYVVPKGYIGLDGMSITVIQITSEWFTVTFIPHTQNATITHQYGIGDLINIEVDMMGKYIEKLLGAYKHAI